jgi:23S rRNA (cytidine1920-2'-O)/16S rRNA (cytidine1409-2'-O)-methyltransferase
MVTRLERGGQFSGQEAPFGGGSPPHRRVRWAGNVKRRADTLLVDRGLARSRSQAQGLVRAGCVYAGARRIGKAGQLLSTDAPLTISAESRFVSRGGDKLDGALRALAFDVAGMTAVDIGASTGGFTDCLLQRGARAVIAVDVGRFQLAERLRADPRVTNIESVNARQLTRDLLPCPVDLVVVDASFISLSILVPAIADVLDPGGHLLVLVKPQFEVGREEARRARGVVRDPVVRSSAITRVRGEVQRAGFQVTGECDSTLPGPRGNLECFLLARRLGS